MSSEHTLYGEQLGKAWRQIDGAKIVPLILNGVREMDASGAYVDVRETGQITWPTGLPRDITVRHPTDIAGTGATQIDVLAWTRNIESSPLDDYQLRVHTIDLDQTGSTSTTWGTPQGWEFWDILEARVTAGLINAGDIAVDRSGDGGGTPASSRVVIKAGSGVSYNAAIYVPPGWMATITKIFVDQDSTAAGNLWGFAPSSDRSGGTGPEPIVFFVEQKAYLLEYSVYSPGAFVEGDRLRFVSNAKNTRASLRACVNWRRVDENAQPARRIVSML